LINEAKPKRRWWWIALAVAAGLVLGWQAAQMIGHHSGEAQDAAITGPQSR
jgi:hypothetical protein